MNDSSTRGPGHPGRRVLICGAGIAGLTAARLLGRAGWEVELVERAPALREEGYMLDFFGPGYDAADRMGLLPELQALAYKVSAANYVDKTGRPRASLDYERMGDMLDGQLLSLLRGDLERVIHDSLDPHVVQRFGCTVETVEETKDCVRVTLSDGTAWEGDLLIGADGVHSTVRRLAFGPESSYLRYLGFHTAAWTFDDPEIHRRIGDQFAITDTADKAVGLYGLRNGRVAVFAVHRRSDPAMPEDPRHEIQTAYADLGWLVPETLQHCPQVPDLYYDQVAQIELATWTTRRIGLLGDACQAVSLLAGQGASLAMSGALVLAEELERQPSIGEALSRYHARLAPVVLEKQAAGRRTAEWFLPSSAHRLLMRRLALKAMRLPFLGRLLSSGLVAGSGGIP